MKKIFILKKLTALILAAAIMVGMNPVPTAMAAETVDLYCNESMYDGVIIAETYVSATFTFIDGASVDVVGNPVYCMFANNPLLYNYKTSGVRVTGSYDAWIYVSASFTATRIADGLVVSQINPTIGCSKYGETY